MSYLLLVNLYKGVIQKYVLNGGGGGGVKKGHRMSQWGEGGIKVQQVLNIKR
jgi:hypothetical protein